MQHFLHWRLEIGVRNGDGVVHKNGVHLVRTIPTAGNVKLDDNYIRKVLSDEKKGNKLSPAKAFLAEKTVKYGCVSLYTGKKL